MNSYTEWQLGTAAANDSSIGTIELTDPQNVLIDNAVQYAGDGFPYWDLGSYMRFAFISNAGDSLRNHTAKLIVDGEIVGTNTADDVSVGTISSDPTDFETIGDDSELFGVADLTARQVRRSTFGIAMNFCRHNSGGTLVSQSNYLTVTGFDFNIPLNATITGIEVRYMAALQNVGGGLNDTRIHYVLMRVHYSYDPVLNGKSKSRGYIQFNEVEQPEISQAKHYQYLSYEKNQIRGQWRDVISVPSILNAVNQLPGQLTVDLARNLDSVEPEYEEIELTGYGGEVLVTTQNNETILAGDETSYDIGAGTDLEVDHTIKVKEFYGGWKTLTLRNGEDLLTSQGEAIEVPDGYPRGRMYYHGYVSDYGFVYDSNISTTAVKLLHLSDELNNEIYKTEDMLELDNITLKEPYTFIQFGGFFKYPGDSEYAGFTFRAPSTFKLKRMTIKTSGWRDNIITITIRSGATIGSGTFIGSATATINASGIIDLSYAFAQALSLTNATDYNAVLTSEFIKQTGSQSHPAAIYGGNDIANHLGYYYDSSWKSAGTDVAFQLWEEGGETRVNELSIAPSDIQKKILDFNVLNGGIITYANGSIIDTETIVSAPFNVNTLKEAGDYVLKLAPSDWYYYVDPGQLIYNLKPRSEEVDHWFTLRKDIISLKINKNIENILNEVYFTGGGDPALLKRYIDVTSQSQWRKGLAKLSDVRVTDDDTAQILMESEANRRSQPIWIGTLEVLRSEHPKFAEPGQIAGFVGFQNIIDSIVVQMMSVAVRHDRFVIQLGTQPPKTSKRIEDIKRNLTRIEIENNPSAPA